MNINHLPVVLYGAGKKAVQEMEIVKNMGLTPVCFCDTDTTKQGDMYLGLPVLSFEQIKKEYRKFDIYVTPELPTVKHEIFDYLLQQGIARESIINCNEERYASCEYLETRLMIDQGYGQGAGLFFCCKVNDTINVSPSINWYNNTEQLEMEDAVSQWIDLRDRTIHAIRNGDPCECAGCSRIATRWWPSEKKLKIVPFGFEFPCQLSCIYCSCGKRMDGEQRRFMRDFDYRRFVKALDNRGLLSDDTRFTIATGELTINSRKDELLDAIEKYKLTVNTNAIVFDSRVAELTTKPGSCLIISIDAGTRKTYKLIKGMDAFNKVWSNVKKYSEHGVNVQVKYIFLPENSNDLDIDGFIQELMTVKAKFSDIVLILSSDMLKQSQHTEEQIRLIAKMYSIARQNNILVVINETFRADEIERIKHTVQSIVCRGKEK